MKIPDVELVKRKSFGFKSSSTQCWLENNCYTGDDVIIYKKSLGYKFIQRKQKLNRQDIFKK